MAESFFSGNVRQAGASQNAAELRALGPVEQFRPGQLAGLLGGNVYYWDPSSTATDDGATVIKPDALGPTDPGRWLIINLGSGPGAQGAQGGPGATGAQGAAGTQGAQGGAGTPGAQGSQGGVGAQGGTGAQGVPGTPGGPQGAQGAQGDMGSAGFQGFQGRQGNTGAQGLQGDVGAQGSQGVVGAQGVQGAQGAQGAQGSVGAQGSQGNQGLQGSQGFQGFQGVSAIGQINLSSAGGWSSLTSGNESQQQTESTTNKVNTFTARFLTATQSFFECQMAMPSDYDGGTLTAVFYWMANSSATDPCVLGLACRAYADGDTWDQAYGTVQEVTKANNGQLVMNITTATAAITPSGTPGAGCHMQFRIERKGSGADTLAATVRLLECKVTYTRLP